MKPLSTCLVESEQRASLLAGVAPSDENFLW